MIDAGIDVHDPLEALSILVTGRTSDLFVADLEAHRYELRERIAGSRILVVGGAGSVGSATIRALLAFRPRVLHVVDHNENSLVRLVRDLRADRALAAVEEFRTLPLDFGSPVMRRFLRDESPYDLVLNFAAHKHVRSEKDVYSSLQLLDTNTVRVARFWRWVCEDNAARRCFWVSTDKAANPSSLMGASKRIMEHIIFSDEVATAGAVQVTSARFANVAFSDGSLLESFLGRLQKRQPLAVPRDTRRYFITLRESGQLCLLASTCGPNRHLLIPRLDPDGDSRDLQSIAVAVLRHHGFDVRIYEDEREARRRCLSDIPEGYYPLVLTQLDTSGEKPSEEFVSDRETAVDVGMSALVGVGYDPAPRGTLATFLQRVENAISSAEFGVRKEDLVQWISAVVPEYRPVETGKSLDDRM